MNRDLIIKALSLYEAGERGDHDMNAHLKETEIKDHPRRKAAVLVPIVEHAYGLHVLLTQRTEHLRTHAGQVSFPGGAVDETDRDAVHTAMREAHEEIGLTADYIKPIGKLDTYLTGSGFEITPIVAFIQPGFTVVKDAHEVADVFEVPLDFLMDKQNHQKHVGVWKGIERKYYAIPHEGRQIWGATAGMLVNLHDLVIKVQK